MKVEKKEIDFSPERGLFFERFSLNQRVQHIIMVITFVLCSVTGLPIKYSHATWAPTIAAFFGGFDTMFKIHTTSGLVMIVDFVYHLFYLGFFALTQKESLGKVIINWNILPKLKDIVDFFQNIGYNLGLIDTPADFDRFTYKEKFDYWAVFWGMIIIGISGLMMMFTGFTAQYLPRWIIDCAQVAHSDEALLAIAAIGFWHFYNVHLSPDFFPMNRVWLTGELSKTEMEHEHPAELRTIMDDIDHDEADVEKDDPKSFKFSKNRLLIILEILFYLGVLAWFLTKLLPIGLM